MNKPRVVFQSAQESGNIYFLLNLCRNKLETEKFNELKKRVFESESYSVAISEIKKDIDLVDLDKEY